MKTFSEFMHDVYAFYPEAEVEPDNDGQLVIYTNLQLIAHPTTPEGESCPLTDCLVVPFPDLNECASGCIDPDNHKEH